MARYKRVLETVEAFQYNGDFEELRKWYTKNAGEPVAPFERMGREVSYQGIPINSGDFIVLSPWGKILDILTEDTFKLMYREVKEEDVRPNKKKIR